MNTDRSTQAGWKNGLFNSFIGMVALLLMLTINSIALAGEKWPLLAGQSTEVGFVEVDHDMANQTLSVTYTLTAANTTFGALHLWVGNQASFANLDKSNRPPPGQFPYVYDARNQTTHTFVIDLADLFGETDPCGQSVYVIPHAEIYYGDGTNDTAYGFEFDGKQQFNARNKKGNVLGAWWYYGIYLIDCAPPEEDQGCFEYQGETAWSDGLPYNPRVCTINQKNGKETCTGGGNWALYTPYNGDEKTVEFLAGQTLKAGTVTFSAVDSGQVTITIAIDSGWRFKPVAENVKIQGYTTAPSGNPAPGQFTTHKGQASGNQYPVTVAAFNYYGVHVDVEKVREVPCPANE